MKEEELTEEERARLRGLIAVQKVVLGIALRWWFLFVVVFLALLALFSSFLWMRGSKSVKRFETTTRLLYSPKKVSRVDPLGDKQLMTILERASLKRRVQDHVDMELMERMCLTVDMKIEQSRRQSNLFTLTAASQTRQGAYAKVNAYADILIDEYVAYRSKDLELCRYTLRMDGFFSWKGSFAGGRVLTKPLVFEGDRLYLNFATSALGYVRIIFCEENGSPIPGFDSGRLFGDSIRRPVDFENAVSDLAGKPVRILFELKDADLYSFRFEPVVSIASQTGSWVKYTEEQKKKELQGYADLQKYPDLLVRE